MAASMALFNAAIRSAIGSRKAERVGAAFLFVVIGHCDGVARENLWIAPKGSYVYATDGGVLKLNSPICKIDPAN